MKRVFPGLLVVCLFMLTSCVTGRQIGSIWRRSEDEARKPEPEQTVERKEGRLEQPPLPEKTPGEKPQVTEPAPVKHGVVTAETLNVRAGGNLNYEVLTRLEQGDRVEILSQAYGWYEINLPVRCYGWMHRDYVDITQKPPAAGRIRGKVTGDSVRVRTSPMLKCTVLTTLNSGARVVVVDVKDEWYKIELPEECTGWVSDKHIRIVTP